MLAHAADLSGTWVSCDLKSPWAYSLLSVDREGADYRWTAEWGAPYAAGGTARQEGKALVLTGCRSYRGEINSDCDKSSPPVFARLRKADFERRRSHFTETDLRTARWVRVSEGGSWEQMAAECTEHAAKWSERHGRENK